jgi:hypothetical protein
MDKIYKLIDPNTLEVRYIGYTNRHTLKHRLSCHLSESKRLNKCHRHWWINSLLRDGKRPIIKLIRNVSRGNWQYWEMYYISKYKEKGCNLVNGTNGGDGQTGMRHSEKTKRKIRRACKNMGKGRVFTKEHCLNISKGLKGKSLSKSHRDSLRVAGLGRIQSEETKNKMSITHLQKDNPTRKPIRGIHELTGKIRDFKSINDAIRQLKKEGIILHRQQLSLILNGRLSKGKYKRLKAKGYFWKWN